MMVSQCRWVTVQYNKIARTADNAGNNTSMVLRCWCVRLILISSFVFCIATKIYSKTFVILFLEQFLQKKKALKTCEKLLRGKNSSTDLIKAWNVW